MLSSALGAILVVNLLADWCYFGSALGAMAVNLGVNCGCELGCIFWL